MKIAKQNRSSDQHCRAFMAHPSLKWLDSNVSIVEPPKEAKIGADKEAAIREADGHPVPERELIQTSLLALSC